jgi:prevent-host-death family protein
MYQTEGVSAIATITELRSDTSSLIDHVTRTEGGVMIQKNNEPQAALISWETYLKLKDKLDLKGLQEELTAAGK